MSQTVPTGTHGGKEWTIYVRPDGVTVLTLGDDERRSVWEMPHKVAVEFFTEGYWRHAERPTRRVWRAFWRQAGA